jgi:hypothetical protein
MMRTFRVVYVNEASDQSYNDTVFADEISFTVAGDLVFEIEDKLTAAYNRKNWVTIRDISKEQ